MASASFSNERRPTGSQFRKGDLGRALDDLYSDIEDGFVAAEALIVTAGGDAAAAQIDATQALANAATADAKAVTAQNEVNALEIVVATAQGDIVAAQADATSALANAATADAKAVAAQTSADSIFYPSLSADVEADNSILVTLQVKNRNDENVAGIFTFEATLLDVDCVQLLTAAARIAVGGNGSAVSTNIKPSVILTTGAAGNALLSVTDITTILAGSMFLLVRPLSGFGIARVIALTFA